MNAGRRYEPRQGRTKLGLTISEIARELRSIFDARLKEYGMSNARWMVLWAMDELGAPTPQNTLARLIGIEHPTLVRMLDRLEEDGLVRRVPSEEDRRVKLVELCEKADALLDDMFARAKMVERELYSDIDDTKLQLVHEVLLKVRDNAFAMSGKTPEDVLSCRRFCCGGEGKELS